MSVSSGSRRVAHGAVGPVRPDVGDDVGGVCQPGHWGGTRRVALPHVELGELPRSGTRKLEAVRRFVVDGPVPGWTMSSTKTRSPGRRTGEHRRCSCVPHRRLGLRPPTSSSSRASRTPSAAELTPAPRPHPADRSATGSRRFRSGQLSGPRGIGTGGQSTTTAGRRARVLATPPNIGRSARPVQGSPALRPQVRPASFCTPSYRCRCRCFASRVADRGSPRETRQRRVGLLSVWPPDGQQSGQAGGAATAPPLPPVRSGRQVQEVTRSLAIRVKYQLSASSGCLEQA
jgi:hypothetical protein